MSFNSGLRGESHAARATGAACSVVLLALVTGCDPGSPPVRIENHCDVAIQVSYSTLELETSQVPASPPAVAIKVVADVAIEVTAGASSTLKPDTNGDGWLVIRGDGDWLTAAPLDSEGAPDSGGFIEGGVFVVDGALCAQLDG